MQGFVGRLSKHSNRSQPAIAEQPLSATGPGSGLGTGGAPAAGNSGPGLLADSPAEATPPSANTALSSSEPFVDALQNLASQPSTHRLCDPHSAGASLHPTPLLIPSLAVAAEGLSPSFNGRQRFQTTLEQQRAPPPPSLNVASQRLHPQQQQQFNDIASATVDQAPGSDVFQHSPTATGASEKRSTRKLIKGIFSSSGRTSQDPTHQHKSSPSHGYHGSYDNTAGLARHSSKKDSPITLPNTTIRSVPGEQLELSSYEDDRYQPPDHPPQQQQQQQHSLQRRGTLHVHEHQVLHEPPAQQTPYDQPLLQTRPHGLQHPHLHPAGIPSQGSREQFSEPHIVLSHSSAALLQHQNPETISQLSYDSWITDSDQRSLHQQNSVQTSPAAVYSATPIQEAASAVPKPTPAQMPDNHSPQQPAMVPPGGVPPSNRRLDAEKALRGQAEPPLGPATGYRQGSVSTNPMSPLPPTPGQNLNYRGDRASQYEGSVGVDQGRDSPQPPNTDQEASTEVKFKELLVKYKNVKRLYFENKFQITQLTGQVEQLQNAVANQRMSQSRTAWDDNEYSTRFNRLNGAINNLSFNIRKAWRCLPPWLDSYVSADAVKTGKQEMTAVGRAIVSRWIVEEIFDKCFHPGLDPQLSSQLKQIELSIRGNAYTMHSQEEFDALTTKVVNWRMATLDGLQQRLNSPEMGENRAMLTSKATKNLTAYLYQHLSSPPPSDVEGSTSMIAELAVAIATNLPIESRDVAIMYPLPGDAVQTHLMEIEKTGLPTLDSHKLEIEVVAEEGEGEVEDEADKDVDKGARGRGDKSKTGFSKDAGKVRFAGFMALEVKGRQVLMKAPVWTV